MSKGVVDNHPLKQSVIVNHLIPFLSIIDYINFRRSFRQSKLLPSPADLLLRRFESRIRNELHLAEEVIATLVSFLTQRDDVFLSGGFLVSLLRGDAFRDGQDLDFFFSDYDLLRDTPFWIEADHNIDNSTGRVYDGMVDVVYVYTRGHVQFIEHDSSKMLLNSISRFDIPVCRNAYNRSFGLRLCNIDALTHMQCVVDIPQWVGRARNINHLESLASFYGRLSERIEKYKARGFSVGLRVGEKGEVEPLFQCPVENVPHVNSRSEMFKLMGQHNPDSCVFTKDCRCKGAGDPAARWCKITGCDCEHHQVFYQEMKKRWADEHAYTLWEEYEAYWTPCGGPHSSQIKKQKI
jgi:hypothetical protein